MDNVFGHELRRARIAARMTQEELAERAGLSTRAVRNLERGQIRRPRLESVRLLGAALGLAERDLARFRELAEHRYWAARDLAEEGSRGDRDPTTPPDDAHAPGAFAAVRVNSPAAVPAHLPCSVRGFTGRKAEVSRLDSLLSAGTGPDAPTIVALTGTAGVGKTALAVHWAHRVRHHFPDGQLFVNLRGFDLGGSGTSPATAMRGFLDALGVPAARIPADPDCQSALYRSLMAGKRILVVLDNARDSDHVRALLPGSPGCLAVVTSRNQLTGLVALEGAWPLNLDLLSRDEARQLLAGRLGDKRLGADAHLTNEIITRCARLPLALAIAAARAATQPGLSLGALSDQLRDASGGLEALVGEGAGTDLRAVFSWSYQQLSPGAAKLFRLLGPHPGATIATPAVTSLAGLPTTMVGHLLAELTRVSLLTEPTTGRYTSHELLRAYATDLHRTEDGDAEQRDALRRLLDHYVHTAHGASALLAPERDPIALDALSPGAIRLDLTTAEQALTWHVTEWVCLVAAIEQAAAQGLDRHVWQLAWALSPFFARHGHCEAWLATQHAALRAAVRLGDRAGQADAHRMLLRVYGRLSQDTDATEHFQQALALYAELGDDIGQAHSHQSFAYLLSERARHGEALHHDQRALELYRAAGHLAGQARAHNCIAWVHNLLGDPRQALDHGQHALALQTRIGSTADEGRTLDTLGRAHQQLGNHAHAVTCYQKAARQLGQAGDRYGEAEILAHLGDAQYATGHSGDARRSWEQALSLLDKVDHPNADAVRHKLCHLVQSGPPKELRAGGAAG